MEKQFPIYIPSLGRHESMFTSKSLSKMGVAHNIVVEPPEVDIYKSVVKKYGLLAKIIELDMSYKDNYDYCDVYGTTRSTGSGPCRNFIWEHSISEGYKYHWIMDDNIRSFRRLNKNEKVKCESKSFWVAMEDFMLRYKNVGMAGPNYYMFAPARTKQPPFVCNTRIYSCNLIKNDLPFRWRGRYNEDTILSLDMLKKGWCTILFNAFLQEKIVTGAVKGGNTDSIYINGTREKSQMLVREHPDVSRIVHRFGRIHHHVDYTQFKKQKLIKHEGQTSSVGANNYEMRLEASK